MHIHRIFLNSHNKVSVFPVAQTVEHGASNRKDMYWIPKECLHCWNVCFECNVNCFEQKNLPNVNEESKRKKNNMFSSPLHIVPTRVPLEEAIGTLLGFT